ncbi:MAG: hypothetical protein RQ867_10450 [Mariprofundaceae bacterium]|nr:hypothetical protein [Mariprofundaceae bacterium]
MRVVMLMVCLFIAPAAGMAEDSPNYCLDPETNSTWAGIFAESPDDDLIAGLFALRLGLCELVRREAISLERATDIFETARATGVRERRAGLLRQKQKEAGGA